MNKEENRQQCLDVIADTQRPDGNFVLPPGMMISIVDLAYINGEIAMNETIPDRFNALFAKTATNTPPAR